MRTRIHTDGLVVVVTALIVIAIVVGYILGKVT